PQMGNFNGETMMLPPQLPSGGDGYGDGQNFWSGEGPPRGAPPTYIGPGGQVITIPGDGSSQFMPTENGQYILVQPVNANTNAQPVPTATPKGGKTPPAANTQPTPTPNAQTPAETKPTPAPKTDKTPATKPAPSPKTAPPTSSEKRPPSGTEKDTQ
ncbi:MAG: hypothetical protein M3525_10795, partial [Acidobacteriota bacterium]|nr:hypothetical protein [Acidobacteriota bacterium]